MRWGTPVLKNPKETCQCDKRLAIYLFIYLFIYLYVCLFIYLFIYLVIYLKGEDITFGQQNIMIIGIFYINVPHTD